MIFPHNSHNPPTLNYKKPIPFSFLGSKVLWIVGITGKRGSPMSRPGRKRNPHAKRHPGGQIIHEERPEDVIAVALRPRIRELGYDLATLRDERTGEVRAASLAGFTLGKLVLLGRITQHQCDDGERYGNLVRRHASVMGYDLTGIKSGGFESIGPSRSCEGDPDDDAVFKIRRQFSNCYRALMDEGKALRMAARVALTTYDVCLDRLYLAQLTEENICHLRIGLNVLGQEFRT